MIPRILFVHNYPVKFVQTDLSILRERYTVREWYQSSRFVNVPDLAHAIANTDLIFGWFASWHTLFPCLFARVLKRPALLVVGGYDTANIPEIGYGSQRGGVRRQISRLAMRMACRLVAFSESSRCEAIQNAGIDASRVDLVYLGVNGCEAAPARKEAMIATVGTVEQANLRRKGLEPFVRAAAHLPEVSFILIGNWRDDSINHLRAIAPANVRFAGRISDAFLQSYFSRARVYVQASRHEGFGLSVAEAMLAECIPVVTRAGSLPEVVGDTGVYIDSQEPEAVADGIRQALKFDERWGERGRARVIREFPLARRRKGLYEAIDKALDRCVR